jgi:hypothetical protein
MVTPGDAQSVAEGMRCGRGGCACERSRTTTHCPAHDDKNPSLAVSNGTKGVVVYCHTGCKQDDVISALTKKGLWLGGQRGVSQTPPRRREWSSLDAVTLTKVGSHVREDRPGEVSRGFTP